MANIAEFVKKLDAIERKGRLLDAHCERVREHINNGVKRNTTWKILKSKVSSLFSKTK